MNKHYVNGVDCFIHDWDSRRISGWSFQVKEGDQILVPMRSGKTAVLNVDSISRMSDPKDQYFGNCSDVGYLEEKLK